jgi:membrane-bound lytic murein transglycosylase
MAEPTGHRRLLIDGGKIPEEEMSMQRLRRYCKSTRNRMTFRTTKLRFFRFVEGPWEASKFQ